MARLSDEDLRRRFGSVLESRERLRDPITDEPCIRWCQICTGKMVTLGDRAKHLKKHAEDGALIPVIGISHMGVDLWAPETVTERREQDHWTFLVLTAEGVDWNSNLPRALCECGAYAHLSGSKGLVHNHPVADDHPVTIVGGAS